MQNTSVWAYENECGVREQISCDVLVLGGGLSGCFAAIAAARRGQSVVLVEKGAVERSGSAGTGFDHWESACTNPCSGVSAEEIAWAYVREQDWYSNGIAHYIECREGYDRLLDVERFGGKVRDTDGEFKGAPFRDDETGLMFAYDYKNRFTLRVWGSTFKPALYKELKRLGVRVCDRVEATALLVVPEADETAGGSGQHDGMAASGGESGDQTRSEASAAPAKTGRLRGVGALGMNVRTGRFYIFRSKSTVLCMSRPARVWLFDPDLTGLCEFRPMQSIGSGHAMGWRAGLEFTMMEKNVRAEFSAAGRSFPPYGAGNNHNTWYAATMVDARGVEIPYADRDGRELTTVLERYMPAPGQKFFLKGGVIDNPKYEYRGPETLPFEELARRGYQLPFYADLSRMPEMERKVIWGMMVGEEAKTKIPILKNYTDRGFDPSKHRLQSYGTGWQSANFLEQERQFFGAPGGFMHDWDLKTNADGIYVAGDTLFASDCAGFACATGYYAGRKAAEAAHACLQTESEENSSSVRSASSAESMHGAADGMEQAVASQIEAEYARLYAPLLNRGDPQALGWRELNAAISKAMQNYCGGAKCDDLFREGLRLLKSYETDLVPHLSCANPHDLMRTHEVLDILTVAQIVLQASLLRKKSSAPLSFVRTDHPEQEEEGERRHIVIHQEHGQAVSREVALDYFGDLQTEYERRNASYIEEEAAAKYTLADAAGNNDTSYSDTAAPMADGEGSLPGTQPVSAVTDAGVRLSGSTDKPAAPALDPAALKGYEYALGEVPCSVRPIRYDPEKCIGCNSCVRVCQCDILFPSTKKGETPKVLYPGECYYCGACVMACPKPGAITLEHPVMNRARFIPADPPAETEAEETIR